MNDIPVRNGLRIEEGTPASEALAALVDYVDTEMHLAIAQGHALASAPAVRRLWDRWERSRQIAMGALRRMQDKAEEAVNEEPF